MSNVAKSLQDVGLKAQLNIPIILISAVLMFIGSVIPAVLTEYSTVNLFFAVGIGAAVSIVGNLILLYGLRNKLVKVFFVTATEQVTLTDKVEVKKSSSGVRNVGK